MTATVSLTVEYFHPWTNSTGFFVAALEGLYRDVGIDLDIRSVDPRRGDSLSYLVNREADFAVFPTNRLFARREQNESVLGIAAINHRAMETIHTLKQTGISRPRDLAGRRIALNPTPRGLALVKHLVRVDGGRPEDVEFVDSRHRELGADDIAIGTVDATFGNYWAWDVLFGRTPASERVVWPVDEIGAPGYHSYLLGVHENLAQRNPGLIASFLAATEAGYRLAVEDPAKAREGLEFYLPYFPAEILNRSLNLVGPTWFNDGRWGVQRDELHAGYAKWLHSNHLVHDPEVWRNATTNHFVDNLVSA